MDPVTRGVGFYSPRMRPQYFRVPGPPQACLTGIGLRLVLG